MLGKGGGYQSLQPLAPGAAAGQRARIREIQGVSIVDLPPEPRTGF